MNSKDKGNIGEAIALAEFMKRGIPVSIPYGDNARYDLIADFNGKLNRIQVKYCGDEGKTGSVICRCASCTNHTTNKHYTSYKNDVDYFVFYLAQYGKVLLVPIEIIGNKKDINFRIAPVKNNQKIGVTYAEDFLIEKMLKNYATVA